MKSDKEILRHYSFCGKEQSHMIGLLNLKVKCEF